jgi:hypothetical protein
MAARCLDHLRRRVGRQQQGKRVAGQARDQEDDHARAKDADQAVQQAFCNRHDRLRRRIVSGNAAPGSGAGRGGGSLLPADFLE